MSFPSMSSCYLHFQFRLRSCAESHSAFFTLVLQPGKEGFGARVEVVNILIKGSVGFLVARGSLGVGAPGYLTVHLELIRINPLSDPKRETGQAVDHKGDFEVPEDSQNDCVALCVRLLDLETTVGVRRIVC